MVFNERYAATLWKQWRKDPSSVAPDWDNAFQFLAHIYGPGFFPEPPAPGENTDSGGTSYARRFGHLHARLDPLGLQAQRPAPGEQGAYAGTLTVETGHIDDPAMVEWIAEQFEAIQAEAARPSRDILWQLIDTEAFDSFMAVKFPTKKRFGSEGADAIFPMLHALRDGCPAHGVDEIVMGSMHRGRLSLLRNFAGMPPEWLFAIIKGRHPFPDRSDLPGDVPYHFGHSGEAGGIPLTLLPNPSHLETINPVALGYARARRSEGTGRAMGLIIHTDASVVGQGVNAELLQLSTLPGFAIGGTIHIVINNQIGFTTEPHEARSSRYCSGPWRAIDSLLLHVNGDDVDACVRAVTLALKYRERFERDVVIDLICYRKNGHNEIDEPRFTQPGYYAVADTKRGIAATYEDALVAAGTVSREEVAAYRQRAREALDTALAASPTATPPHRPTRRNRFAAPDQSEQQLIEIAKAASHVPEGTGVARMAKLMEKRLTELDSGVGWALGEALAIGTILKSGISVRLCGQDVERGSFSQRHLAAIHPEHGARAYPLASVANHGATLEVVNSPLSEYAVLGFEYGHALGSKGSLCIWEAQFGDFLNGAQIMVDQIITSGFEKWMQTCNLVVLLPHGLEGQGPEHSSARIERLLQLCARDNIIVAHPSTPANYFHLLQHQAVEGDRPLFVITPKKLLRLPQARSALGAFVGHGFDPVIVDQPGRRARRAILCSGKIAYELAQARGEDGDVAIVRLEQLYPFPAEALTRALAATGATEMLWLQEEPANFGAGAWLHPRIAPIAAELGIALQPMVSRAESASPAGGFHESHDREQDALLTQALGLRETVQAEG